MIIITHNTDGIVKSIAENKKFFYSFLFPNYLKNCIIIQINKKEIENEKGKIIYETLQKNVTLILKFF